MSIPKRCIFVSYHHRLDQEAYDLFSELFHDIYGVVRDNSVDRKIDSDNADYIIRNIREKYISGTSCTFVLCGAETYLRKFVDWEIKATLDKQHGLIAVVLPSAHHDFLGRVSYPDRLQDNIDSGYGVTVTLEAFQNRALFFGKDALKTYVESAISKPKVLIVNNRPLRTRNGSPPPPTLIRPRRIL